jgi:hypothetical protein
MGIFQNSIESISHVVQEETQQIVELKENKNSFDDSIYDCNEPQSQVVAQQNTEKESELLVASKVSTPSSKKRLRESKKTPKSVSNSILKEKYQPEISGFLTSTKKSKKKLNDSVKLDEPIHLSSDSDDDFKRVKRNTQAIEFTDASPYFQK